MNQIKWPSLSIHDFLGYFVPGALTSYLMLSVFRDGFGKDTLLPNLSWETGLLFFLVSYIGGYFMSFLSALFIESYAVQVHGYPSRYIFRKEHCQDKLKFHHIILRILILPITCLHWFFGKKMKMSKKFIRPCDEYIGNLIDKKVRNYLSLKDNQDSKHKNKKEKEEEKEKDKNNIHDIEYFHLVGHWVRENASAHSAILQAHVARKGFLRTLAFLFVIGGWIGWSMFINVGKMGYCVLGVSAWVFSYVAFLAYLKQERRFTLETLLAFAVTRVEPDNNLID